MSLLALPGLGILAVVMGVVALTRAPGPVLYRQCKLGWGGRRIMIYRFRTLRSGAGPVRVRGAASGGLAIPLGGFLRFTGLGELPQVLNVLRGEMTLVGPRPLAPGDGVPGGAGRPEGWRSFPGLLGLPRNSNHLADWLAADEAYRASMSWWGDVRILVRAGGVVVLRILGFGGCRLNRDRIALDCGDPTVLMVGESRRPW